MKREDTKITIIGMGFLMGFLYPCYEEMLGGNVATNINAVTADEETIEHKRAEYPFEITLHDNLAALRKMQPDIIFFAPPPKVAPSLAEEVLVPYFAECREAGRKVPEIYAFPPSPKAQYYLDLLGQDVLACNLRPNMNEGIEGYKFGPNEGVSIITFATGHEWTGESLDRLVDFFRPIGLVSTIDDRYTMTALASNCVALSTAFMMNAIAEELTKRGDPHSYNQIAQAMRTHHEMRYDFHPEGTSPTHSDVVSPELYGALCELYDAWNSGVRQYLLDTGITPQKAHELIAPAWDVYFHTFMLNPWDKQLDKSKNQSTKGGVAEKAVACYELLADRHVRRVFSRFPDEPLPTDFLQTMYSLGYLNTQITDIHGNRLAQDDETPMSAAHHAIIYALMMRNASDLFGQKGVDAVNAATRLYGNQRGARMAARAKANGDDLSMRSYLCYGEWSPDPGTMQEDTVQLSPVLIDHVLLCPWNNAWRDFGFTQEGGYYCTYVDKALVEGFNPELSLTIDFFQSDGVHPYCRFIWDGLDATPDNVAWMDAKKAALGRGIKRDWTYHIQHLHAAFAQSLPEQLGDDGRAIADAAVRDFGILFGPKMAATATANADADYWQP